ncbi:zinc/cadmium/mercury/lead-transporting ATPase [Oceanimonas sp. GK1]|uniref:heavy metal translocating P-type ATPase n=1 Tax=Oceanimonas sp. (strain GK1 / IBRC-M 10197) TaxID=511062 RepID=UPI0002494AA6|nr:heavy metal translocating P-type ATPase [Oceanimonas sp. GK1]AEY00463.1 zinc/cadmium/mercury/lead-transporting ATPase [Oceanimonas sp. GK1]
MSHCCDHHRDSPASRPAGDRHGPELQAGVTTTLHHWRIGGMDCPSCAGKIETAVRRLPGVHSAEVRFATERLQVRLTPQGSREQVVRAIHAAGFTPFSDQEAPPAAPFWRRHFSLLGLLLLMLLAAAVQLVLPAAAPWLFTLATLWGLVPIARQAGRLARSGSPFSIEMLMTVAATGALFLGETAEAAMVLLLFGIGEKLESLAAGRARQGVKALMALVPEQARRLTAGGVEEVAISELLPDDHIEVHPGGRLPADGILLSAQAAFDESAITGESLPVERSQGDRLAAGSLVVDVAVRIKVTSQPGHSTLDRILHLMEEADASRAPIARFIDRFSRWYTPAMIATAALVAVLPPLALGAGWETWIYRGLVLLLIGCPCALVISTPAAVTSALAAATRMGVLIKGGAALEQLGKIDTLAFDKTGTLTQGQPVLHQLCLYAPFERRQVLALAAGLESGSHHPLASALVNAAETEGIEPAETGEKRTLPGAGIASRWQGKPVLICTPAHLDASRFTQEQATDIERLRAAACTLVVLVVDERIAALFGLQDPLRQDAKAGIAALQALGVRGLMLTGDHEVTARHIAAELGMEYHAGLTPEHKLQAVARLSEQHVLGMVGDGINDAPALKQASIGIAMGQGTDVALDSADAALTHNRLTALADAVRLSRATRANIHQNITLALGLKAVFLVTSLLGITGLWLAVLADTGATALVTLNALRLLGFSGRP